MDKRNYDYNAPRQRGAARKRKRHIAKRFLLFVISLLLLSAAAVILINMQNRKPKQPGGSQSAQATPRITTGPDGQVLEISPEPEATPTPTPSPTPPPPIAVSATKPDAMGVRQDLNLDGNNVNSYSRSDPVVFGDGSDYSALEGVITFRGNSFRDTTSYGTPKVSSKKLEIAWQVETSSIPKSGSGAWTGAGWTGQPIIVKWPEGTRKAMNILDGKKNKDGLVEVIYAIEDGRVYFLDLEDGKKTRDTLKMGITFKGSGGIDPRGIPLLYVGAGDSTPNRGGYKAMSPRFFIVSLLDFTTLYELGVAPDPFAQREWHAYDSAATIHADSDTLFEPGENGILYSMKLNTKYDEAAATLTIDPSELLKMRYTTKRARDGMKNSTYWLGMESSAAFYRDHMYVADNCGTLLCIDVNTMKVTWAADVLDDTNGSPVVELENGHPYVYISTSFHGGWRAKTDATAKIPLWKFDGLTGEIVWQTDYECATVADVSGGVQSTPLMGKGPLKDLVFFSVARTPSRSKGVLVALDKKTGDKAWELPLDSYAWSSPVAIYSEDGNGYVIQCESAGRMLLVDGLSGKKLDEIRFMDSKGENPQTIEATPSAFGDTIVVGTRGQRIYGIKIK